MLLYDLQSDSKRKCLKQQDTHKLNENYFGLKGSFIITLTWFMVEIEVILIIHVVKKVKT